jgi:alkanesulfonate monooxygenase SsuD/methylene tetrahydromethanopterin reductase-like flavin-dependent oxidoreductase (luciferase family)
MLRESIQCVRGLLTQESTDFDGEFFQLRDARCEPKPVQERLPIWVGGGGEKVTLRIAAEFADGWNIPFVSPEEWGRKSGVLTEHCAAVGRDPGEITRTVNVGAALDDDDLKVKFGNIAEFVRPGVLVGVGDQLVDRVGEYVDQGAEWVILAMRTPFDREGLERFASTVIPAFRTS